MSGGPPTRRTTLVPDTGTPARYAAVSGDSSPVHLDEAAARAVGLPGVILHGLYLFGVAARAAVGDDQDPRQVQTITAQFRAPGLPGHEVAVEVSPVDAEHRTVTLSQGGVALLRNAAVTLRSTRGRP